MDFGPSLYHRHTEPNPPVSDTQTAEEIDTSTRPRLTQEQVTVLEEEFSKLPKPNTDFKKELASRIGLTLARVNNWYQNRRAKTKHGLRTTEAHFEVRPEELQNPWGPFDPSFRDFLDTSMFDAFNSQLLSPDLLPTPLEEPPKLGYFMGGEELFAYNADHCTPQLTFERPLGSQAHASMLQSSSNDFTAAPRFPGLTIPNSNSKQAFPDPIDFDMDSYSSESVAGIAMPEEMPVDQSTQHVFQMNSHGLPVGNVSSQTVMSATSSSDGEQQTLMTPPEGPSPITFRPEDALDRRGSITGTLTTDFQNGFHLQSRKSSRGLQDAALDASFESRLDASGKVSPVAPIAQLTPNSPSQLSSQGLNSPSITSRIDLAARRKRPRPAPLVRPDAQRSHSYAGPLTASPQSRKMLLDPSRPVRRVRSGLEVVHGRIQKPTSSSAQVSPGKLEAQFDRQPSLRSGSSVYPQAPPTPLSATQAGQRSLDLPPNRSEEDEFAQHGITAGWENSFNFSSPPITPYSFSRCPTEQRQASYASHVSASHEPPQSAPPQKTNFFFGDSPPMPNSNLPHPNWQVPVEVPSNAFPNHSPTVVPQSSYNAMPAHYEQPQMQFAYPVPQYQGPSQHQIGFQGPASQAFNSSQENIYSGLQQYPFLASMGPYQRNFLEAQPQPQPLEIKVELGPSPQGTPQPRKQYTFSNSTPEDFSTPKEQTPS